MITLKIVFHHEYFKVVSLMVRLQAPKVVHNVKIGCKLLWHVRFFARILLSRLMSCFMIANDSQEN